LQSYQTVQVIEVSDWSLQPVH